MHNGCPVGSVAMKKTNQWNHNDLFISHNFREEVEDFFRTRDRDFDGFLSFEEFLGEESQIEKLFKKMDKDNDGKVSKQVRNYNNLQE